MITTTRFEPLAVAFGNHPRCKTCKSVPARIEYARDLITRQLHVAIVCKSHHTHRAINLERIVASERSGRPMINAIVIELRRRFGDVLEANTIGEVERYTEIVRRPIVCGNCGAPSDPKAEGCMFCGAQLAGVAR